MSQSTSMEQRTDCPHRIFVDSTVDVTRLHDAILRSHGRVEFHGPDGGITVLLCKSELDALEQALEILSKTDAAQGMRAHVQRLASGIAPIIHP